MSRDYRKLRVFRFADELAFEIYEVTRNFPKSELFGMTSQIRRAALSVSTNIVEGSHRESHGNFLRFLDIALGSIAEVGYLLDFSARLGYIDPETEQSLKQKHEYCIRSLKALINSLRSIPNTNPKDKRLKTKDQRLNKGLQNAHTRKTICQTPLSLAGRTIVRWSLWRTC